MIRKLLIILLALNLFDGAATYIGLHFQLIEESNPLMKTLFDYHPILFLLFKIGSSALLLWFLFSKHHLQSTILKTVCILAVSGYALVGFLHMYWIYIYVR